MQKTRQNKRRTSSTLVDIYFACVPKLRQRHNDVTMTLTPSNVIQYNACPTEAKRRREYNPFVPIASEMQTSNSWTRDTATKNNFLGNGGTELNTTSQLYDLEYRNYDPALGRMNGVDPMANKYSSLTPYNYSFNNPVMFNDPSGADPPQTINYSAQTSHWFTFYTYDDRIDETELRFFSAVCGQCWRTGNAEAMAFYAGATGGREFGMSMSFGALSYSRQMSSTFYHGLSINFGSLANGVHKFSFGSNGVLSQYSFLSEAQVHDLGSAYTRDLVGGTTGPIVSNYTGGARLWQGSNGNFATFSGFVAVQGQQTQGDCPNCWLADYLRNTQSFGMHRNLFFDAEAIYVDASGSFIGHEMDRGGFFVLVGKDKGKFFTYSEKSIYGTGTDAGVAGELGSIDVTGNPNLFKSDYVYGYRDKFWAGGGEGPSVGLSYSLGSYNGQDVTAIAVQFGWSFLPISLGWNKGIISPSK